MTYSIKIRAQLLRRLLLYSVLIFLANQINAQVDTIATNNLKLDLRNTKATKHSYAVFFTDSLGDRTTSADIWDRETSVSKNADGSFTYYFEWKWYNKDSLALTANAKCKFPSLQPMEYVTVNKKKQKRVVQYEDKHVTVHGKSRKTQKDTAYHVIVNLPAFAFPMDIEIYASLPLKRSGQQFAIPFYEPGSPNAKYYKCSVIGKENLNVTNDIKVKCWLLKVDYSKESNAIFWITDSGEMMKMRQLFKGGYRYKVRLF